MARRTRVRIASMIIIDRVFYILDLAAVAQIPETSLQILLLDRGDILGHMAVEAVGNVGAVGNMLNHAVFLAELRNL